MKVFFPPRELRFSGVEGITDAIARAVLIQLDRMGTIGGLEHGVGLRGFVIFFAFLTITVRVRFISIHLHDVPPTTIYSEASSQTS